MRSTYRLFDIDISVGSREELLSRAKLFIGKGGVIATVNPEILNCSLGNPDLKRVLRSSLCIPDGIGVALALRKLGCKTERLPGVELGEALLEGDRSVRLGIIGGREGVAEAAMQMLTMRHGNVIPEFALCGYDINYDYVGELLSVRCPEVVFVCLGSPMQELFISKMRCFSEKTLFIGLGGSADIYSGEKRRAPSIFRAIGLEWAWRMFIEPKRLKRVPSLLHFYINVAKINKNRAKYAKKRKKLTDNF